MLGKLMKYELRATGRWMLPLYGVTILLALGANVSSRLMQHTELEFLRILGVIINVSFAIAIIALGVVTVGVMVYRFKTNLLGDEGYVMHTLPASVHQHIWAKLIISILWYIASAVILFLGLFLATASVATFRGIVWSRFWEEIREISLKESTWPLLLLELIAIAFLVCIGACLIFYAAMALGHSFNNHKMALSILFFFGFQFAVQFILPILMSNISFNLNFGAYTVYNLERFGEIAVVHQVMLLLLLINVVIDGIFYAITAYSMKRRLNLA